MQSIGLLELVETLVEIQDEGLATLDPLPGSHRPREGGVVEVVSLMGRCPGGWISSRPINQEDGVRSLVNAKNRWKTAHLIIPEDSGETS